IWTRRPSDPWLSRGIEAQQRDSAVLAKWKTTQAHAPDRDIPANNDCRSLPGITSRNCNRAVQFRRFTKRSFPVVIPRRFAHQSRIDQEQIPAGIVLQQFNRATHHVRKAGLFASLFELVRKREFRAAKSTEKFRTAPCGNRFQFRPRAHDVETVAAQFEQKIAAILPLSAFCLRKKRCDATAHGDVDLSAFNEFACDAVNVVWIGRMRVKSGARWIGQFRIRYQARSSSTLARQFDDAREWFSIAIDRDRSIVHSYSGGQRSCGGSPVRNG